MGIGIDLMVKSYKKRNLFGQQRNSKHKSDRRLFTDLCPRGPVSSYRGGSPYRSAAAA
jgi:hypothetical protein